MAWKRGEPSVPQPVVSPGRAIIASAALYPVQNQLWKTFRFTDTAWQAELWRLYDCVPEFHFLVNYVGSACGRVRIYAADVDDNGRVQLETEDQDVADLVENMLGGPEAKAECIRSIGINLAVAGEVWIVGRTNAETNSDEWLIVSSVELRRAQGGYWLGYGDDRMELQEGRDLLIRAWTPHPRFMLFPDPPSRAVYPVLVEIEKLTRYISSQLDSRLAGAGVWMLPSNLDFPASDDGTPAGTPSLMKMMIDTASASLKGSGSAAALVPILLEVPPDVLDKIKEPIKFESVISDQAKILRDEAIERLALGMDTPPEVLNGTGATNHWSAWHVDESTIKAVIEPLMNRVCDALNKAYFLPALKAMGKDPKQFTLHYDTSGLTVRPQRLQDTLNLNAAGIASDHAVLRAGDYKIEDYPEDFERNRKFMQQVILRDPQLIQDPEAAKIAGLPDSFVQGRIDLANTPPPPPPAPDTTVVPHSMPPAIPENSTAPGAPAANATPAISAAAYNERREIFLAIAEATALRTFELAGGRLLTSRDRGRIDTPRHEIHTVISCGNVERAKNLVAGGFTHLEQLLTPFGTNVPRVQAAISSYCVVQLVNQRPHSRQALEEFLAEEGVLGG